MRQIRLLIAALFIISPLAANADLIQITGAGENDGTWEISLHEGRFNSLTGLLMSQVWWGDGLVDWELAVIFADALGEVPGVPVLNLGLGPWFAYYDAGNIFTFGAWSDGREYDYGASAYTYGSKSSNHVFATARRVPEPGTLALLALGLLGIGLTRKRTA